MIKELGAILLFLASGTFKSSTEENEIVTDVHSMNSDGAIRAQQGSRSDYVWSIIDAMDEFKTGRIFTQSEGKATFTSFHYLVLPIWWKDEWVPATGTYQIVTALDQAIDDYTKQSFKKFSLTYDLLPQWRSTVSKYDTRWFGAQNACFNYVASLGYVQGRDFDGIIMVHNEASSGVFVRSESGLATMNGNFATMAMPLNWKITRHEIGHNFGHYHHSHNHYKYRFSRPDAPLITDGFDMMSGGNSYSRSDLAVSAKWYYNWIPEDSLILMQPEGSTEACPSCVASGTFTLKALDPDDWWNPPKSQDKLGIHIPIMAVYDDYWESYNVYSYWLSYRGNNDFARKGLSLHLSYFELAGSTMGAWHDSMNFDASGFSDNKADSFVTVGNCYHMSPPGFILDRDVVSASAVQPVVCVKSIDMGNSITITMNFQDSDRPPEPSRDVEEYSISCPSSSSFEVDSSKYNLFHMHGMGEDGSVTLSVASTAGNAGAFFYDDYPYSPLVYDSLPPYGSMQRLYSSAVGGGGGCTEFDGAIAIKITNNREQPVALNEINLFDENGNNVALQATCYSKSSSSVGNPDCLNNNDFGNYPASCISESAYDEAGNFDFCVLPAPVDIKGIQIYPAKQHGNNQLTNKNKNIKVELFAKVTGLETVVDNKNVGEKVSFSGNLATFDLLEVFTGKKKSPWYGDVDMELPHTECDNGGNGVGDAPEMSYQALLGEVWALVPPWTTGTTYLQVSCTSSTCLTNQYMKNGGCTQCPNNYRSSPGATSVSACWPCPEGTGLPHPLASSCVTKESTPTRSPTAGPTALPTRTPTAKPTVEPTDTPTPKPTAAPTARPTSFPTSDPTAEPTSAPTLDPTAEPKFLFRIVNGEARLKTCSWLNRKNTHTIFQKCTKTDSFENHLPARDVCTICCEDSDERFFLRNKTDANGNIVQVTQTCSWLRNKNAASREKQCKRTRQSNGVYPAKKVCRELCGLCN